MEAYELMVAGNSLLLLIVTGLIGVIWSGLVKDKDNNREDFRALYNTTAAQNSAINDVLRLAQLNSKTLEHHAGKIETLERK